MLEIFGTDERCKGWLDSLKKIEDIREKRLKNEETEGRLIERTLVETHLFGALETLSHRLLGDVVKNVARQAYALARSGAAVEEAETMVREQISAQLRPVKQSSIRALRNAARPRKDHQESERKADGTSDA